MSWQLTVGVSCGGVESPSKRDSIDRRQLLKKRDQPPSSVTRCLGRFYAIHNLPPEKESVMPLFQEANIFVYRRVSRYCP
jgi:hypothetical protein